jgi:hypothetical protein
MPPEVQPDFTGQVVKVYVSIPAPYAEWSWWWLDSPVFQLQQGRVFLVGRLYDRSKPGEPYWGRYTTASIPWNDVLFYMVETVTDRQQRKYGGPDCQTLPL